MACYSNEILQELYLPELQSYGDYFIGNRFKYDIEKGVRKR